MLNVAYVLFSMSFLVRGNGGATFGVQAVGDQHWRSSKHMSIEGAEGHYEVASLPIYLCAKQDARDHQEWCED
jgi:hypothetical protein